MKASSTLSRLLSSALPNSPLKRRVWIVSGLSMLLIGTLLTLGVSLLILWGYAQLENNWTEATRSRLQQALATKTKAALANARDYASWNDTAEAIRTKSTDYVDANLNAQTFTNLGISGFIIFDIEGRVALGRLRGRNGADLVEAEQGYWNTASTAFTRRIREPGDVCTGYLLHEGRHHLFVFAPVLNNEGTGPIRGYLLQLRPLDPAFVAEAEGLTGLTIRIGTTPGARTEDTDCINQPLPDVHGNTLGFLQATFPRTLHRYAHVSCLVAALLILITILIAEACILVLIQRLVLRRVDGMHASVEKIKESSDLGIRLPYADTPDELGELAASANRLIAHLEESRKAGRKAEEEKELLNSRLQQAQKLEAIGTMTGGIAHDFNNLLSGILCSTDLIRLELPPGVNIEEHLQRIDIAGKHASSLIKKMMTFSRAHPVRFELIHLGDAVTEVLHIIQSSLPKSVNLRFRNEALGDTIMADVTQVQQIVMNLVTNAGHALAGVPKGLIEVCIRQRTMPDHAFPESKDFHGDYLHLEVRDNGSGIPQAVINRIFEPYFTTKPVGTGTGLGLAVVHGIVAKHKGFISVESVEKQGTSFHVFIPHCQVLKPRTETASPFIRPLSILLVDDDSMARESIAKTLQGLGHKVTSISNPDAALLWLKESANAADLLITDQLMPGMTGIELGTKARELRPGLKMLMLSGFTASLDPEEIIRRGFAGMAMKPVSMERLKEIIRCVETGTPLSL